MSMPNEIKMCRICTLSVSCGSGEWRHWWSLRVLNTTIPNTATTSFSTQIEQLRSDIKRLLVGERDCCLRLITSLQQTIEQRNIVSHKNERYCVSTHFFDTNAIHNCMQLKLGYFLIKIKSLPNEINMSRIFTSNVTCGSGEMVSGASGGEFECVCNNQT